MRKMGAVSMLLLLGAAMLGCNAAKQASSAAPAGTNITSGTWVVTVNNFIGGRTDAVTVVNLSPNGTAEYDGSGPAIGYTSCDNSGLTYTNGSPQNGGTPVVGPACFVALGGGANGTVNGVPDSNITSTNTDALPLNFIIGVPTNPVSNGSVFNIQYAEIDGGDTPSGVWQMDGTGTINSDGTATGTWVCDSSTSSCSGITGTFTATQQ
jgi:hypothetical protein